MPEKNELKDANPLKKEKNHQNLCTFNHLYPLLLRLCRPEEVTKKLKKHTGCPKKTAPCLKRL